MRVPARIFLVLVSVLAPSSDAVVRAQGASPHWSISPYADNAPLGRLGVAMLWNSDTYVVDDDALRILRIDKSGAIPQRIGGKGDGPGEFRSVTWMGKGAGDSLYVWDSQARRLSIFSGAGKFVRAESPEHGLGNPEVFGRLRDGRWLIVTESAKSFDVPNAVGRKTILNVGVGRTVRQQPTDVLSIDSKRFVGISVGESTYFRDLPGMDLTYLGACDNGFVVGRGAQRRVDSYASGGQPIGTMSMSRDATVVKGADRQALIENWAGVRPNRGAPPTDPRTAEAFAKAFDAAMPRTVSFTEQFSFGTDRTVWISPSGGVPKWQMLGDDGTSRPMLQLPDTHWVVGANEHFVLVKWYGDNERLELWPRPGTMRSARAQLPASLGTCTPALVR